MSIVLSTSVGALANPIVRPTGVMLGARSVGQYSQSNEQTTMGGLAAGQTWRQPLGAVTQAATDLSLVFGNFAAGGGGTQPTTSFFVRASLEIGGANPVALTSVGAAEIEVLPGHIAAFDFKLGSYAQGTTLAARWYIRTAADGDLIPTSSLVNTTTGNAWLAAGDQTTTVGTPAAATFPFTVVPAPLAVLGHASSTALPYVVIWGDSIAQGQAAPEHGQGGWARSTLQTAANVAYMMSVKNGQAAHNFLSGTVSGDLHIAVTEGVTTGVIALGRNDLDQSLTSTQIIDYLTQNIAQMKTLGASKVIVATITPASTSTDSWATTGNQTTAATNAARVTVNTAIRAGSVGGQSCTPLLLAEAVESATDSGIWKATYTADGTHPTATGHTAMAAIFAAALPSLV